MNMRRKFRFRMLPKISPYSHNGGKMLSPDHVYKMSVAYRKAYMYCNRCIKRLTDREKEGWDDESLFAKIDIFIAAFTNLAFSCELLLKAILLNTTGEFPKVHHLKELFLLLDGRFQKIAKDYVLQFYKVKTKKHFDSLLEANNNMFEILRYNFDHDSFKCDAVFLAKLIEVLDDIFNKYMPPYDSILEARTGGRKEIDEMINWQFMSEKERKASNPFYAGLCEVVDDVKSSN